MVLAALAAIVRLPKGATYCEYGDVAKEIVVVIKGELSGAQCGKLMEPNPGVGRVFGEVGLLAEPHFYNVTLKAVTDVTLACLSYERFSKFLMKDEVQCAEVGVQ